MGDPKLGKPKITPDAKDKCWMVFDYGGGTLDVAIVSTRDNQLEVINSEGDNYFGGTSSANDAVVAFGSDLTIAFKHFDYLTKWGIMFVRNDKQFLL